MRTIALVNQKGGAGKSTLATNLAAAGHLSGQRTLLLDLDPQGTALDWFHARADGSPLAGLNVVRFDQRLTRSKFEHLAHGYELVVIDTPPKLEEHTRAAAVFADAVVIPVEPAYFNLWACDYTFDLIDSADMIRDQLGLAPLERYVVLNKADERTKVTRLARESLQNTPGFVAGAVHLRTLFVQVTGAGESVLTIEPTGAAAVEIRELYEATQGARPLAA